MNIDLMKLPSLPLFERAALPNVSAIYFVIDGKALRTTAMVNFRRCQASAWLG